MLRQELDKTRVELHLVIALLVTVLSGSALAQDAHYWTNQYGTRSTLLGGAVIGSVSDLSSAYYNPGGLALVEESRLIIDVKSFQYSKITLTNVAGTGMSIDNERLSSAPSLFAGSFSFEWLKDHRIAYSILTRHQFRMEIDGKVHDSLDVVSGAEGLESVVGDVRLDESLTEVWVGFTWGYQIGSRAGVGLGQHLAIRTQSARFQTIAEALTSDMELAATITSREHQWQDYRLLWKAGVRLDSDRWAFGVTVTTPSVSIFGSGSLGLNNSASGLDVDGDGVADDELVANFEEGVSPEYRSPLSVGVGSACHFGKSAIHLSIEWFDEVAQFDVMQMTPFQGQTSGHRQDFKVTHELSSVVNYGIGLERSFSERLTGYASFWTDFAAAAPNSETNLSVTRWDIYHVAAGSTFRIKKSQFALALAYSFGRQDVIGPIDFTDASAKNRLLGSGSDSEFKYRSLKLSLGFSF